MSRHETEISPPSTFSQNRNQNVNSHIQQTGPFSTLIESLSRIRDVIIHPRRGIRQIIEKPDYWGPCIVLVILALLIMLNFALAIRLLDFKVSSDLERDLEDNNMQSAHQVIRDWRIIGFFLVTLDPVIALLVMTFLFWLLLRYFTDLSSSQRSFRMCFSILGYISITNVPQELIKSLLLIQKSRKIVELNDPGEMKPDEYITHEIASKTTEIANSTFTVIGTILSSLWLLILLYYALRTLEIEKKQAVLLCILFQIFKITFSYIF
ncbi:MAG: Yip1 family protein [Promethearchaeota archaeon]